MRTRSTAEILLGVVGVGLLSFVALTAGCAHEHHAPPPPQRSVEYRDWTKLGERWVDGTHDRDVIAVGEREGSFRRIMVVVENSALEMYDVDVMFADGTVFSPHTRHVFAPETRSHSIDLPGSRRIIQKVAFRYGNLPGGGRARAELWAQ